MSIDFGTPEPRKFTEEIKVEVDPDKPPILLALNYELSRVKIEDGPTAVLVLEDGSTAPLEVKSHDGGRRITITREAEEIEGMFFPNGAVVQLTVFKIGDAPNRVQTEWDDGSRRRRLEDGSLFATGEQIFDARSRAIDRERKSATAGSAEARRLRFEAFLVDWDRETFASDEVAQLWTEVGDSDEPLGERGRALRRAAVDKLSITLFQRAKARGMEVDPEAYEALQVDPAQLALIGDLHERLFKSHFGELNEESVAELGRHFLGFATGAFARTVKSMGGDYQNGRPNGAILVTLAELSLLLKAEDGRAKYWADLHPWFVGCIAAYARSHYESSHAAMGDYGVNSLLPDRRIEGEQASLLEFQIGEFQGEGSLNFHWRNLLHLLAPGSFHSDYEARREKFGTLDAYFAPPSK